MFNDPTGPKFDTTRFDSNPGMFSRALSGVGGWMQQNPELFAITADSIGSKLAPDNAFAGTGTMLGKSSLASKAEKQRMGQQDSIMQFISALTAPGTTGGDAVTVKTNPDGTRSLSFKASLGGGTGMAQPTQQAPQAGQAPGQAPGQPQLPPGPASEWPVEFKAQVMEMLQQQALGGGQ